jgi:hypothetical protein
MKNFALHASVFFVALTWPAPDIFLAQTEKPAEDHRIRIFITDSRSWEMSGSSGGSRSGFGGNFGGGARPQTAEIIKTFRERCPLLTITNDQRKARFIIVLDHEGGKKFYRRDNKVAVFNAQGDAVFSVSKRSLGNAVAAACGAIMQELPGGSASEKPEGKKEDR